jgi:predicted ATP-grasp superfamily ATP-dependent carboligase
MGGSQGDLGVVRTLGRAGVDVTVVSEYEDSPVRHSRYTKDFRVCPTLTRDDDATLEFLTRLAQEEEDPPVLFPTADPDLALVDRLREPLAQGYRLFISRPEIIASFTDKGRFFHYASAYGFPVPRTVVPGADQDVAEIAGDFHFPVIVKPLVPQTWTTPEVYRLVAGKKAIRVDDADALTGLCQALRPHDPDFAIQEYVHGRDDRLYSVHAFISSAGRPLGAFAGQKIRTYPTYAGIGCFVKSVHMPDLVETGLRLLSAVDYTGLALLQFKQDERSGEFKLLEINPRASSWNLLAYACGVNLPYLAYCDAIGREVEPVAPKFVRRGYLFFDHDVRAFLDYRKHGDWTWPSWIRSLLGRNVYQYLAWDDLAPFIRTLGATARRALRKVGLAR